jgi:hypothetical protein
MAPTAPRRTIRSSGGIAQVYSHLHGLRAEQQNLLFMSTGKLGISLSQSSQGQVHLHCVQMKITDDPLFWRHLLQAGLSTRYKPPAHLRRDKLIESAVPNTFIHDLQPRMAAWLDRAMAAARGGS